jgi:hypothetical protein
MNLIEDLDSEEARDLRPSRRESQLIPLFPFSSSISSPERRLTAEPPGFFSKKLM